MKTSVTSINLRIFLALLLFAIIGLLSQTSVNITGRAVFSCPAGSSLGMLGPGAGGCCASGCSMPYTGSGYGCSAQYTCMPGLNCRLAQGFSHSGICEGSPLRCGDGVINIQGEECDGADLGGQSCQSLNRGSGNLKCSSNCKIDVSSCSLSICGDRIVSGKEECDGSHLSCPLKPGATHVTCMPDCTCDYLFGLCGDGRVDGTEECDRNANTCQTKPNTNVKCNSTCQCEYQAIIQTPVPQQPITQSTTSTPGGPCSGATGLNCPSGYKCDKGTCTPLSATIVNQPLPTTQQPTTQPLPNVEEQACMNGGGVWRKFSNTCADSCSVAGKQPGSYMCGQAITDSCDCGQSNCWNGIDCISDPVALTQPIPQTPVPQPTTAPTTSQPTTSTPGGQCGGNTGLSCSSGYKCDKGTCTPLSATIVTQPLPTTQQPTAPPQTTPPPLCGDGICQGSLDCPQDCTQSITQQPTTPPQTTCPGCLTPDNACLSNGMRWNYEYCDTDNQLEKQKLNGDSCLKSFECEKNFCKDNICQDKPSWLSQAITWVTSLFTP